MASGLSEKTSRVCRAFSLDDFYDYEKHFTVMNYQEEAKLKQVRVGISL